MALSSAEIESLRFHLGYGNLAEPAFTYTPDGFKELFDQVVAPNLTGDTETSATTAIAAGTTVTVTPVSMTDIVAYASLVIDVGASTEIVLVRSVTGTTFSATFTKAHPSGGYPIAVMGGHARLRLMLHQADLAWEKMQSQSLAATAGIKEIDNEVEFFAGFGVLKDRLAHYKSIICAISSLVRVPPAWGFGRTNRLETY